MPVLPPPEAKKVFEGKFVTAYQWPQKMYDGSMRTFECYVRADTVAVIAFLDRNTILLTKQEQPGREGSFWDPPGGMVDPGETPEEAAARELLEETGYRAGRMMLWHVERFQGITRFEDFVYIATDLEQTEEINPEAAGEKIELHPMPLEEAVRLSLKHGLRRGEVMISVIAMQEDPEAKAKLDAFLSGRA